MTTSQVEKILTIQVNAGWQAGTKVVFAKEGDQGPNKIPGILKIKVADIVFNVKYKPHQRFKREGNNLLMQAEVPLVKALVGYSLAIETLDGRTLLVPVNDTITYRVA
jgi:DnaJ family protein B protein 13